MNVLLIRKALESQLQRQLKGPGTALLKERVQSSEPLVQHLSREKVCRSRIDLGKGVRKIRVIEYVKCVCAELEADPFGDCKFPGNRKIDLHQIEAGNVVEPLDAHLAASLTGEGRLSHARLERDAGCVCPDTFMCSDASNCHNSKRCSRGMASMRSA